MSDCPTTDRLRSLLDGQLSEAEQAELQQHIDECDLCQRTLESLVAGKESWDGIARQLGDGDTPVSPALHDAINSAKEMEATIPSVKLPPGLLRPAEQADSMGRLAHYEVLQEVGSGGMGVVLKAFDTSLRRVVAVKVMAPHLAANAAARRRFVREAQAAAAVAHEHVVAIHAVADQHDPPYLAMQFIEGKTLQERLDKSGPLSVREVLRIGMQTAAGLAAAHAQGLVHRDIKPANILLENGVERVKLTDFGLARAVDDASVTQSGVIAGTPLFMSPEQARGESVDHRSDLFSLGSVMYAMCVGHAPFRASTTMGVIKRVCDDSPRPIREVNPDVPDWLVASIDKLLAKNPADRFHSAMEVAELLGQCLAHFQQPASVPLPAQVVSLIGRDPKQHSVVSDASRTDMAAVLTTSRPEPVSGAIESESWLARVPKAAWIGLALILSVYAVAFSDLQGEIPNSTAKACGALLLAASVIYLAGWGAIALLIRAIRGPQPGSKLEPLTWRIVMFFSLLTIFTIPWVSKWVRDPEAHIRAFLFGDKFPSQGTGQTARLTYQLPGAHVAVTLNGEKMDVSPSGRIDLQLTPGEYVIAYIKHGWPEVRSGETFVRGERKTVTLNESQADAVEISGPLVLAYGPGASAPNVADYIKLQGRWAITSQERNGEVVTAAQRANWIEFDRGYLRTDVPDTPRAGAFLTESLVALYANETPARIDLLNLGAKGIYKLERDTLTLAIADAGQPRPSEFVSRPASAVTLTVCRRATASSAPLDLNGVWDTSHSWPVEFTHWPIKPNTKSVPIQGKYAQTGPNQWAGRIDGTLDVATRTIDGEFFSGSSGGKVHFVVSEDDEDITGTYAWRLSPNSDEFDNEYRWDMRRRAKNSDAGQSGTITLSTADGKPFDWKAAALANSPLAASINLNGDWDSRWKTVTFQHELPKPGDTTISVSATYYDGGGVIEGTLNLVTRTFNGRFRERNGVNGPIRLIVSPDGHSIQGLYEYRQPQMDSDPTKLTLDWNMTRRGPTPTTATESPVAPPTADSPIGESQAPKTKLLLDEAGVWNLIRSPDGKLLAAIGPNGGGGGSKVKVWDTATLEVRLTFTEPRTIHDLVFLPDGQRIATCESDHHILVRDLATGGVLQEFAKFTDSAWSLAVGDHGEILIFGSPDMLVRVWDLKESRVRTVFRGATTTIHSVAASLDGKFVAAGCENGHVFVWDAKTSERRHHWTHFDRKVTSVAFSPDSQHLAGASWNHLACVFDIGNDFPFKFLKYHTDQVRAITWSPDGRRVATASSDGTAIVWDAEKAQRLEVLDAKADQCYDAVFLDDNRLATTHRDGFVRVWDAKNARAIAE